MPPLITENGAPSHCATRPGFQLAELRAAHEEDHVHAGHAAAQPIGRFELADDVADHHAHRVGGAGEREAERT